MSRNELEMKAVYFHKKTYHSNGMKIEVERMYITETHTLTESIVLSSEKRLHLLQDDNSCARY